VRELENTMVRAVQLARSGVIETADLGLPDAGSVEPASAPSLPGVRTFRVLKKNAIEAFERDYLTTLMREEHGNVTRAARVAGKERRELGRLLKKHGLTAGSFGASGAARLAPGENTPTSG
jgi:DNA-binding NtrC family response regulator